MRPAKPDAAAQSDMFRETLEAILDPRHELLELGRRIDWAKLDAACGETFVDQVGRPGLPTRLMAGCTSSSGPSTLKSAARPRSAVTFGRTPA
jgi:IS5 family transposase